MAAESLVGERAVDEHVAPRSNEPNFAMMREAAALRVKLCRQKSLGGSPSEIFSVLLIRRKKGINFGTTHST